MTITSVFSWIHGVESNIKLFDYVILRKRVENVQQGMSNTNIESKKWKDKWKTNLRLVVWEWDDEMDRLFVVLYQEFMVVWKQLSRSNILAPLSIDVVGIQTNIFQGSEVWKSCAGNILCGWSKTGNCCDNVSKVLPPINYIN